MHEVRYPGYRTYCATRQEANNAIVALLAGSRLAVHTLQLTEGSERLLPEIFPAVNHINRFNLKTESARSILLNADGHLGAVSVPYALAIHEDFVQTSLEWLRRIGVTLESQGKPLKAWNMHEALFDSCGHHQPSLELEHFHLLREMRNCQIHAGGVVSDRLQNHVASMTPHAISLWKDLTDRQPGDVIATGKVTFTTGDIFASFAVTKQLGRDVNIALQRRIPRGEWIETIILDYESGTKKIANSDAWMRGLCGYTRMYYPQLALTNSELENAAVARGQWRRR